MPNTHIFSGESYSATSYGGISINGAGDTAKITFKDHNRNEKLATLKVYELSKLKKLPLFKEAQDSGLESLVNSWTTKKTKNSIIKFSTDNELAFVFSSDEEFELDFLKLFEGRFFGVEYFKEIEFNTFLKKIGMILPQKNGHVAKRPF
ncbi:TPA: hypothetical protein ACIZBK_003140 [Legionella pneumophila]